MPTGASRSLDSGNFAVHFLDVGPQEYGDAVLCQFGDVSVLIDGAHPGDQVGKLGHPSIPGQIAMLLGSAMPQRVSLLIVTHAHQDHIGCLPFLVEHDLLRPDWALVADPRLGWGRPANDGPDTVLNPSFAERGARQLSAALREERLNPDTPRDELLQFMIDADGLEQRYNNMLSTLAMRGTRVVRHGRDDPAELLAAFAGVGLRILGPSSDQLAICAERIARATDSLLAVGADVFARDNAPDPVTLYRQMLTSGAADALDAENRPGAAVNLQSIVTSFEFAGQRVLFTGDMQFADPQLADDALERELLALRQQIRDTAPYSLVKLAHHGSDNAFDAAILEELGDTTFFAICAGEKSSKHPNPRTLALLEEHADELHWARTDHNRLTTFTVDANGPKFVPTIGQLNDPRPNVQDEPLLPPSPPAPILPVAPAVFAPVPPAIAAPLVPGADVPGVVEVITRVPHVHTRVTVTIEVAPGGAMAGQPGGGGPQDAPFRLAGGRALPPLLFVTSRAGLERNIGRAETAQVLATLQGSGQRVYADLPAGLARPGGAAAAVRAELARYPDARGVVLIGGYDVVPSVRQDVLDPGLRAALGNSGDPDNFIVWSDAIYGDRDSDGLPEVPVSRIPDGLSSQLVQAALGATGDGLGLSRWGLRNVKRPFAAPIYAALPGTAPILVSEPTRHDQRPSYDLTGERVYLMLHGSDSDGTRFWGESAAGGTLEAINLRNLPARCGPVVFAGCCWGALVVDTPANSAPLDQVPRPRTASSSLALSFLAAGAIAFVGCTGAHYSPVEEPYDYFGGPLHDAFWRHYNAQQPPAVALFEAKMDYLRQMPHGRTDRLEQAIESKILRQFTCLGLGW